MGGAPSSPEDKSNPYLAIVLGMASDFQMEINFGNFPLVLNRIPGKWLPNQMPLLVRKWRFTSPFSCVFLCWWRQSGVIRLGGTKSLCGRCTSKASCFIQVGLVDQSLFSIFLSRFTSINQQVLSQRMLINLDSKANCNYLISRGEGWSRLLILHSGPSALSKYS